jgi:NitT/TauT family transport system substrate-binding protein
MMSQRAFMLQIIAGFLSLLFASQLGWAADKTRVLIPEFTIHHLPFYVAQQRGFYKEENLDVEIVRAAPQVHMAALLSADVDFSGLGGSPIRARLMGAPIKTIAVLSTRPPYSLISRPNIRSVAELKGRSIAVPQVGTFLEFLSTMMLQKHGLKASDVTYRSIGASSFRLQAVREGIADAAVVSPPFTYVAVKQGLSELVFFANEISYSPTAVAAPDRVLKTKPEVVRKFLRAVLRGMAYVRTQRADSVSLLSKWTQVDKELAALTYDRVGQFISNTGFLDRNAMLSDIEIQRKAAKVNTEIAAEEVFDFSFVQQASLSQPDTAKSR